MPLDGGKVLVVVVSTGGHISHKVIEPTEEYDPTELQQAANYLNSEFKGQSLLEVRQAVLSGCARSARLYDELMARALRLASTTFEDIDVRARRCSSRARRCCSRTSAARTRSVTLETLRTLLRMIEEKTRLVQLLDDYISADGLTVVIGTEHHAPDLQRFSLVASTYSDGRGTGAVGVIGPTRMRYSRAINAVEGLSQGHQPDGRQPRLNRRTASVRTTMEDNAHRNRSAKPNDAGQTPDEAQPLAAEHGVRAAELQRERDELLRSAAAQDRRVRQLPQAHRARAAGAVARAAAADLIDELLPLVDDLERALQAETGSEGAEAYRRGVELIHRQLLEILRKRGVQPIEALGADFDPHYHQAVAHEPAAGRREGEVIEEFRRGYMLGDRLLRPSMVKVAKGEA